MKRTIFGIGRPAMLTRLLITASCLAQDATTDVASVESVNVTASPLESLRQEQLVGPNQQPEWTTEPTFGTSRVYVRPPGQVELVQFWTPEFGRDGSVVHPFREEIEIGLPYRFQVDFYGNWEINRSRDARATGGSVELRYALANWGKIPLNPTFYGEWNFNRAAADVFEIKLLLGQVFLRRWHYGANVIFEQQIGDERETEWQITQALSYPVIDRKLNAGLEMRPLRAGSRAQCLNHRFLSASSRHCRVRRRFVHASLREIAAIAFKPSPKRAIACRLFSNSL